MLYSTHLMLSMLSKTPELRIEEHEAEMLAKALSNVASHYDVGASVAPEVMAWMSLAQTTALIYGPRIFAVRRRKSDARGQTIDGSDPHTANAGASEGMLYQ